MIVHLGYAAQVDEWAREVPDWVGPLLDACWPGPLTVILRRAAGVLDAITGGLPTVGLRVPAHPVTREILRRFGGGVAAPSANRFGRVSPTTAGHVLADLGDHLVAGRDAIVDGGPCRGGLESTIVDCTLDTPAILRPGGVPAERIEAILGRSVQRVVTGPSRAPGMLSAHYAPTARVEVVTAEQIAGRVRAHGARRTGVLCAVDVTVPAGVVRLDAPVPYSAELLGPVLYARLRDADRIGLDVLLVVPPGESGVGAAVLDRLRRAATGSATGSATRP